MPDQEQKTADIYRMPPRVTVADREMHAAAAIGMLFFGVLMGMAIMGLIWWLT